MSVSQVRQNFHEETEAALNAQINMELTASYVYQALAYHYDRDDVALPGFSSFFKHNSDEEREHAEKFMKYLNKRGKPHNYSILFKFIHIIIILNFI